VKEPRLKRPRGLEDLTPCDQEGRGESASWGDCGVPWGATKEPKTCLGIQIGTEME